MRIAAGIEYRGTNFLGWQRQRSGRTVQECVETALSKVADEPVVVQCAGRTDTGVHALHQVIHFDTEAVREPHSWVFGSNINLPDDVSLCWVRSVDGEFHARYSALYRVYQYVILNRAARSGLLRGLVTWECRPLNPDRMARAASDLVGEHDFTSYRDSNCQAASPVRTIHRLEVRGNEDFIILEIQANGFLHHMVRNIAGVLMTIGMNRQPENWAGDVLKACDRAAGGVTAPPDGLYLAKVAYPESFCIPEPKTAGWMPGSHCHGLMGISQSTNS